MFKKLIATAAITLGLCVAMLSFDVLAAQVDFENAAMFANTIESEGYAVELINVEEDGTSLFGIKSRGESAFVYVYTDGDLIFRSYWAGLNGIDLRAINGWNYKHRFARMFVDEDKDFALQADVIVCDQGLEAQEVSYYTNLFFRLKLRASEWLRAAYDVAKKTDAEDVNEHASPKLDI